MLCEKPYMSGSIPVGCGTCTPCRVSRRRLWVHRLMLESYCHASSSFLTLTYSDEHLPKDGTLVPDHAQKFIKRLRYYLSSLPKIGTLEVPKIRFYLVGEYGESTFRPHYHAILFGIGPEFSDVVAQAWPFGHSMLAEFNKATARYVAQYVEKKMTSQDDPRLVKINENGETVYLHPEFSRMSNRPGIGADYMFKVADTLFSEHGASVIDQTGDVPVFLMHGGTKMPLGRYLRKKLRDAIGMPQPKKLKDMTHEEYINSQVSSYAQEMRTLFIDAQNNSKYSEEEKLTISKAIVRHYRQKLLNAASRSKTFKQRKSL